MLKNYLRSAFRFISRNRSYSAINILGLVIGISFSCMLYVYINYELSYDSFHSNADRIVRLITVDERDIENPHHYSVSAAPLGKTMAKTFPEVEESVTIHRFMGQLMFESEGQRFMERNWYMADSSFFKVFDYDFISGDKVNALKDPSSIVLTESAARKYFGSVDAVGKVLAKSNVGPLTVTAVIKDAPMNSHLYFDMIISNVRTDDEWKHYLNDWNFGDYTYIVTNNYLLLRKGADIRNLESKMPAFELTYFPQYEGKLKLSFQSLRDAYLGSTHLDEVHQITRIGQKNYIYIFASMGIFLILIAAINYINLATSKAMTRAREVGVRKVAGAHRNQLIAQYILESLLVTFLATIISIGVIDVAFPYFNEITGRNFDVNLQTLGQFLAPVFSIGLIIGLLSGSYPAFHLAQQKPILSLKGKSISGQKNSSHRQTLVVFQFVLSIVMIVCTLVVGRQLNFIQTLDLGFEQDGLFVIDINNGNVRQQFQTMKNEYSKVKGVRHVAVSSRVPGEWKNIHELYASSSASIDSSKFYFMGFDEDVLETYGLKLIDGRYFSHQSIGDSSVVLLNETAVKALSLTDPIGSTINLSNGGDNPITVTVVGILKDFNFQSLHQKIAPIIIGAWNNPIQSIDYFTLKFTGDVESVIEGAAMVHNRFDQYTPIEYHLLDRQLESYYQAEQRAGLIFRMCGALSIFVACLGLLGLATHNIERRMKELSIRKVLGATGIQLFVLIASKFARQIFISFIIASPLAWYCMNEWLKFFEYRITLGAGPFLLSGLIALLIAFITIGYQTLQAAKTNPVNSLRQE